MYSVTSLSFFPTIEQNKGIFGGKRAAINYFQKVYLDYHQFPNSTKIILDIVTMPVINVYLLGRNLKYHKIVLWYIEKDCCFFFAKTKSKMNNKLC